MKRLQLSLTIAATLALLLVAVPLVAAVCEPLCDTGCRHTIKVIPEGATETGEPIVTRSPANLMIFDMGKSPITNVWLLVILNKPTYDNLASININDQTFMTKADFHQATDKKIPSTLPNMGTSYPGSQCQYEVSAIKDKMGQIKSDAIYYAVKFFLTEITNTPTHFTLTVQLASSAEFRALILALGRYDSCDRHVCFGKGWFDFECLHCEPFNACSSFSNSTFVLPEIATLALTASPFGALGLTAMRRRKKEP
jgi:hypothetical protein